MTRCFTSGHHFSHFSSHFIFTGKEGGSVIWCFKCEGNIYSCFVVTKEKTCAYRCSGQIEGAKKCKTQKTSSVQKCSPTFHVYLHVKSLHVLNLDQLGNLISYLLLLHADFQVPHWWFACFNCLLNRVPNCSLIPRRGSTRNLNHECYCHFVNFWTKIKSVKWIDLDN